MLPVLADRARKLPGQKPRREALPIAEDQRNSRITGQPSVAPQAALGNCPALLMPE